MPEYQGYFETHITINPQDDGGLRHFRTVCAELGVKPILIELPRGSAPSQPMTQSVQSGVLSEIKVTAGKMVETLQREGFTVQRIKIEAAPENADLPLTDPEAASLPATNYYEYHWKMLLSPDAHSSLLKLCEAHHAHLSRNAFKHREGEQEERFITLRCTGVGKQTADRQFQELSTALAQNCFLPLKSVCEYCVYDTNTALDEDWLEI